ncbi:MAG: NAD(P)H-hydrate dehydratase [Deltaproteobacteria bacterium]|nr:NAD(P)H-hydrate dehydratase [Planctomycetota bacterium]MBI3758924.1 NAD(P)H-hydrate dehydratase [Deltaproteobacteria bacterium]
MPAQKTITTLPVLPPRPANSHKGDFGRVLVIAGSKGMAGAAILCGSAAMRAGAGLVKVAVPAEILPVVAAGNPCYTTAALPQDADGCIAVAALSRLIELCEAHDVIAVGPGLSRGPDVTRWLIELTTRVSKPMVIDADGLNAFIGQTDRLKSGRKDRIVTPHLGEFARLLGLDTKTVQTQRAELASDFALKHDCVVVLKGHPSIVTDGQRIYHNTTGNPGLAKGGTGDVLTGIIAALLGQHLAPFEAAQLGVYWHGLAGDLARDQIGEVSLLATDVLDFLAAAIRHR